MTQRGGRGPAPLSQAVAELVALRGWVQVKGRARLEEAWKQAAAGTVATSTRVVDIRRGVLHVAVSNSPLLSELAAFHKPALLAAFSRQCPDLRIRDLKFVMRGDLPAA